MNVDSAWDFLVNNQIVSEEILRVVTCINGYSLSTLEHVLYAVTGYRDFDQYLGEEGEDD